MTDLGDMGKEKCPCFKRYCCRLGRIYEEREEGRGERKVKGGKEESQVYPLQGDRKLHMQQEREEVKEGCF